MGHIWTLNEHVGGKCIFTVSEFQDSFILLVQFHSSVQFQCSFRVSIQFHSLRAILLVLHKSVKSKPYGCAYLSAWYTCFTFKFRFRSVYMSWFPAACLANPAREPRDMNTDCNDFAGRFSKKLQFFCC